jgi:hypothetical protein
MLHQTVVAPWAARLSRQEDGTIGPGPVDDRSAEAIAAGIASTAPERDEGDGSGYQDPDEGLRVFVEAVASAREAGGGGWLGGVREYVPSAGPVPSSWFL